MDEPSETLALARLVWESNHELLHSLPIKFDTNTVNRYRCICVKCNEDIPDRVIRGSIKKLLNNVYEINAVAFCEACNLYNIHDHVRLREDKGILSKQFYIADQGWITQSMDTKDKGFLEKLFNL